MKAGDTQSGSMNSPTSWREVQEMVYDDEPRNDRRKGQAWSERQVNR